MSGQSKTVKIESAKYIAEYKIQIAFTDCTKQLVDFGSFLENSMHPDIRKYLDKKKFRRFTVDGGELMWGDFDLIFPIMDLYENRIARNQQGAVINSKAPRNAG
jgi:hypothetical protein